MAEKLIIYNNVREAIYYVKKVHYGGVQWIPPKVYKLIVLVDIMSLNYTKDNNCDPLIKGWNLISKSSLQKKVFITILKHHY